MRTTVVLDADIAQPLEQLRRKDRPGLSQALNQLVRRGLEVTTTPAKVHQRSQPLDIRIDISNIADALEFLDQPVGR